MFSKEKKKEKALLVFIKFKNYKIKDENASEKKSLEEEKEELKNLALSAGAEVYEIITNLQEKPNPKYFINPGKLEEISEIVSGDEVDLVIFDDEVTPAQQANLQSKLKIKVIDRTALILDIFAQRARSREGRLQVELAQLNYLLPRLRGKGTELSRLGGGIGTRGPGESKLESDRRKIRWSINLLEKKIEQISIQRDIQRKKREKSGVFKIALVGYTNSGKSTLINILTNSKVLEKDMLFSTLDSTTRRLDIKTGIEVSISDTVGFIEKLPHQLIAAFKSTLEEVTKADLLLVITDISNINFEKHILSVKKVLDELKIKDKDFLLVFNKIDKVSDSKIINNARIIYRNSVFISAKNSEGIENLIKKIKDVIFSNHLKVKISIPYNAYKYESMIYESCSVLEKKYSENETTLKVLCNKNNYLKLSSIAKKEKSIKIVLQKNKLKEIDS